MSWPIAEKFKSIQGEGIFTGYPMAFIRFVGCSVGKSVCTACDTHFDKVYPAMGGGLYTTEDLLAWVDKYAHVLITGGEPLDRDLSPLFDKLLEKNISVHVETSGTVAPLWLLNGPYEDVHVCVSPKPGYQLQMLHRANEIKIIVHGLSDREGWPGLTEALQLANQGKIVYIQPRNAFNNIDDFAMQEAVQIVEENPSLKLSMQTHKWLMVR